MLLTFRSPSNERMELLTASSVNSGNSLRQLRKVVTSLARASSCSGKHSESRVSLTIGLARWGTWLLIVQWRWFLRFGLTRSSRACRGTFRGNKSAAFSRNRKRIWASRSRRWKAEDSMPTELPSWRAAFAKFLSFEIGQHNSSVWGWREASYFFIEVIDPPLGKYESDQMIRWEIKYYFWNLLKDSAPTTWRYSLTVATEKQNFNHGTWSC